MFRIVFTQEEVDWGNGYRDRGFVFEPNKKAKFPFDFFGYKIWSSSLHFFIIIQKNIFSTLETLLHEVGHLVIYTIFFQGRTGDWLNQWYDYLYWRLLRLWHCD